TRCGKMRAGPSQSQGSTGYWAGRRRIVTMCGSVGTHDAAGTCPSSRTLVPRGTTQRYSHVAGAVLALGLAHAVDEIAAVLPGDVIAGTRVVGGLMRAHPAVVQELLQTGAE